MISKAFEKWALVLLTVALSFVTHTNQAQSFVNQNDTIGTGIFSNNSTGYPAPYGNYYYGARHQFLIRASELPSFCIDSIKSLAFDIASVNSCPALSNFTIKMGHTELTSLTAQWVDGLNTVYTAASYTPVVSWNNHIFQTPFLYNNCDNLVVEICFNNTSWVSSGNASTRYTTTGFTSARYYRADNTSVCGSNSLTGTSTNRPNMILNMSGITSTIDVKVGPIVSPQSGCSLSSTETVSVVVQNNGSSTLTSVPMAYKVNGGSAVTSTWTGSLTPGNSDTFSFTTTANLTSGSAFEIEAYSSLTSDFCSVNDTATESVATQMSGDYTIGGVLPDYTSFSAAIADLNNIGVCGPVTFHVRQGTYNEQVSIGTVPGVSSINTIIFKADSNNTSDAIVSNNGTYVWGFNSSEWVIIDGLNLTQSGTSGYVVELLGVNEHITVQNNVLNGVDINSTSTLYSIVYQSSSTANYSNYLSFINNTFNDGSFGMYYYGGFSTLQYNTGLLFRDNTMDDVYYMGLYMLYGDTSWIHNNTFHMSTSSTTTQYGIYGSGGRQHNYVGNHINMGSTSTCYGIYNFVSASAASRSLCANNMVTATSSTGVTRGIYISASYWDVFYNSVRTRSTSTSTAYASLYASGTSNALFNNAAQKDGVGYACYGAGGSFTHGNNVFFTESGTLTNFALTGSEFNSNPEFNSTSDLYIGLLSDCYNNGNPTTLTTVDIDSNARDGATPDIGASEYTLPEDDAGVVALDNPISPITAGNNNVAVTIKNFGIVNLDTVQVDWDVNGNVQSNVQWIGSLTPGDTAQNVSLGTFNFPNGFSDITAWTYDPNNTTDENMENDTMTFTVCTKLSGTFTVGNNASYDFESIQEAANAIMSCGLEGPVILDIDPSAGPYNEQVSLTGPILGASSINTVTFAGGGSSLEWDAQSSNPALFTIDGANHIIIDSLNMESSNATYGWGVRFANQADSNTIRNCSIQVPASSTTLSIPIVFSNSPTAYSTQAFGGNGNYNTIDNNYLFGGYFGVAAYATSPLYSNTGNMITNNVFDGFYAYGTYLRYAYASKINGNDISRLNSNTVSTFFGIYLYYGSSGCQINNNRIHDAFEVGSTTGYGIYMYNCDGLSTDSNYVQNNIIYNMDGTTSTYYGIYSYSNNYTNIQHNTIDTYDPNATGGVVYNVYFSSTHLHSTFQNNMNRLVKGGLSGKYNIYFATTQTSFDCDYNALYNDSNSFSSYIAYYSGVQSELTNWQATASSAYAQNSVQADPVFTNPAIGDLTPLSQAVDNIGTPLGVLLDIDSNARSVTTPDAGAIEFVGVPGDVALTEAWITQEDLCYGSNDTVWVTIKNVVGSSIDLSTDSIVAHWTITGPVNSSGTISFNSGSLNLGNSQSEFIDAGDLSEAGVYTLDVYIDTNSVNSAIGNDTLNNTYEEVVDTLMTANPAYSHITSPYDTVNLVANSPLFPSGAALFSEITQWHSSTGQPSGGWGSVSWVSSDDGVELIGVPNGSLDGWTVEVWFSNNSSVYNTFTFGTGAALNASGVAYIGWGGTAGNVNATYNYYEAGFCANCLSSGSIAGYILKDAGGNIVDVVANGTSFIWNAATGVTAADWSANMTASSSGTSGIRRVSATDNNAGSDWIVSSSINPQDPGTYNSTVNAINSANLTSFDWSLNSIIVSTEPAISVGPWTGDDTLSYVATIDSICGINTDTAVIVIDLTKAVMADSNNVSCNGGNDGSATVAGFGGDAPYSFIWSNGQTTATATSLAEGSYTVTVTDSNGWPATAQVEIEEADALSTSFTTIPSGCGVSNGSATVSVTGGTAGYTYAWSSGGSAATVSSLAGDSSYVVTITDANGCIHNDTVFVDDVGTPAITLSITDTISCNGDSTAEITASVVSGLAPYTYSWTGSASTSPIASSLGAGTYTLNITDSLGCSVNEAATITEPSALIVSISDSNDALCFGSNDGDATALGSGGVSPYTYSWSSSASTAQATGLTAGIYTVTITDNNGCTEEENVTIDEPTPLTGSFNITILTCKNSDDGMAEMVASGSVPPYNYSWSTGSTAQVVDSLMAGTYTVTVTDDNGCMFEDTVMISEPDSLIASIDSIIHLACFEDGTGNVTTTTIGGTMPYSYAWSNGGTADSIGGLSAALYTLTVTDTNGCQATVAAVVTEPDELTSSLTPTDVSCFGLSDGSIANDVNGGTGDYSFEWSNTSTTQDASNLQAGVYSVTVTDENGCTATEEAEVSQPEEINASFTNSVDSGLTVLTSNGSEGGYQWVNCPDFSIIAGEINGQFTPSSNGSYALIVTVDGCSDTSDCQDISNVGVSSLANENRMILFPNPTLGDFTVRFDGNYGSDVRFEVVDLQGKLIISRHLGNVPDGHIEEIHTPMASGVYFVKAINNDQLIIKRLIVN